MFRVKKKKICLIFIYFYDFVCFTFQVERICVGYDIYGSGKGIFVDDIEVVLDDEEVLYFFCFCWLVEDIGDGKLE